MHKSDAPNEDEVDGPSSASSTRGERTLRPALDCGGGGRIDGIEEPVLRVASESLRALDLAGCPGLEVLDLTAVPAGLTLTVANCPRLHQVWLPSGAPGAVIHWDFHGAVLFEVTVEGAMSTLDACGSGFAFALPERRDELPWRGVSLTAHSERVRTAGVDAAVWLPEEPATGKAHGAAEARVAHKGAEGVEDREQALSLADGEGPLALLVMGSSLEDLTVAEGSALRWLQIQEAPRLRDIELGPWLQRLEVARAPQLARIAAAGRTLRLAHVGEPERGVALSGDWRSAYLEATALAVGSCAGVQRLAGQGGWLVARSLVRWHEERVDALAPTSAMGCREAAALKEGALAGEPGSGALLSAWASACGRRWAPYALQHLADLAAHTDLDRHDLWQARERLRNQPWAKPASGPWSWDLPEDQRAAGIEADRVLSALCHTSGVPVAESIGGCVRAPADLERLMTDAEETEEPAGLAALAEAALCWALRHDPWRQRRGLHPDFRRERDYWAMMRLAERVCRRGDLQLADALGECAPRNLELEAALTVLERLAAEGHVASRTQALAIGMGRGPDSRQAARNSADLQQRAMAISLAPARGTRLAPPRSEAPAAPQGG